MKEFEPYLKCKKNLYGILANEGKEPKHHPSREDKVFEVMCWQSLFRLICWLTFTIGQMYLPPFGECKVEFMRDILNGKKLVKFFKFFNLHLLNFHLYSAWPTTRSRLLRCHIFQNWLQWKYMTWLMRVKKLSSTYLITIPRRFSVGNTCSMYIFCL